MNKKILIDASFKEETRVALLEDGVLSNFDREVSSVKKIKGNIYLAKVIKVEPSLQAAFINYGSDRHGFLPFSDIHPDYFNIPENKKNDLSLVKFFNTEDKDKNIKLNEEETENNEPIEATSDDFEVEQLVKLDENNEPVIENGEPVIENETVEVENEEIKEENNQQNQNNDNNDFSKIHQQYRIEDVIKDGQYLLVQVLKEERGEKGVAMTTYISLAGKYCVLMGNVEGKGGISKKIENLRDRKILKNILHTINPETDKSVIIRTAGVGKKPEEIRKDYIYLVRLWNEMKQLCLKSQAPLFIHSEDDILKRTVREFCDDKIDEIIVEGTEGFKTIKAMVNNIIPEYKLNVKNYTETIPLFYKYNVESQIDDLYLNKINLASGGSIVIDQTEALVAIDVNSGKATKEKSIEETALATNLEAVNEIAKQLRLRDIGGLVVIDFIDMFDNKNKRAVERAMRDATLIDKAKIQIEKLSDLCLMEMSRQRLNSSFLERVSETCPFCEGKGMIRSKGITALSVFRAIKYASRDKNCKVINVSLTPEVAVFITNYKANELIEIEINYGVKIFFNIDKNLNDNKFEIKKRQSLTDEEKLNLSLSIQKGKLNQVIDKEDFYKADDDDDFEFNENCYFEKTNQINQNKINKQQRKQQIKQKNKESKKENNNKKQQKTQGFFGKILKLFKK